MGFAGEQVQPVGSIKLPIIAGIYLRQATIMVRFLLVVQPLAYNVIIRRVVLNKRKVVSSTAHLKMKFPRENGVGEVRRDQRVA
jgi:hypothetical protein